MSNDTASTLKQIVKPSQQLQGSQTATVCAASFLTSAYIYRKTQEVLLSSTAHAFSRLASLDECAKALQATLPVDILDMIMELCPVTSELHWEGTKFSDSKDSSVANFLTLQTEFTDPVKCLAVLQDKRTYHVEIVITAWRRGPAAMVRFGLGNWLEQPGYYKYFRFPRPVPGTEIEEQIASVTLFVDVAHAPTKERPSAVAVRLSCPGSRDTILCCESGFIPPSMRRVFVALSGIDGTARIQKFEEEEVSSPDAELALEIDEE